MKPEAAYQSNLNIRHGNPEDAALLAELGARTFSDTFADDNTPEDMAAYALKYVELGARVVGGCCGNTPEHVAAIARAVRKQSVTSG